ncbi:MAG TPA: radical SAM protein [Candidatus Korarchaeota archaeon]|nr:radical SAM protein [Candidatus Korarchaeota archaeon]
MPTSTIQKESPEYVRVSTAADITLGFSLGKFWRNARLYCINLLLHYNEGCVANCLYCGQAREVASTTLCKSLIRVEWPLRKLEAIIQRIKENLIGGGCFLRPYRVCVATITNRKAVKGTIEIVKKVWDELSIPISALISPTIFDRDSLYNLRGAGAERIGIAIDCASSELFDILRGQRARGPHRWKRYLDGVVEAVDIFGKNKVGIHLIIGLGETEKEAVELIQWAHDMGAETHLFSFYPESNTVLEEWVRPPISQYRRVQLARYLIDMEIVRAEEIQFNEYEQIVDFGLRKDVLNDIIYTGEPFMTSGCPGCNRPFANERPGESLRNYPFPPTPTEIPKIAEQIEHYDVPSNTKRELVAYLKGRGFQ